MDRTFIIGKDAVPEKVRLLADEKLRWTLVCRNLSESAPAKVKTEIELCGPGAEADIAGLFLCLGNEDVLLDITVRHTSGGCTSRQLFKGVAGGGAGVEFNGLIYVARDAQKTRAYQECHSILLSDKAEVQTRPQLKIYADDVECSHGATTGYLSPEEQFYMRSRGIPEAQARHLQIISFLSPVLRRLPEEMAYEIEESII